MNRFSKNHTRSALFLAIASTVGTSQALAQMVIEEVIVTATKRETALMDTAAAVTAFDSNSREELGIETALDLAAHTPSLTIAPSRISIRGVGRPNLALGSDPGVGIYWDGVYTTENDIFNFSQFLDIDRLEVLRGPQGTLYGRNSIGGAVNFVSTKPYTDEWGGKVVGQVGNEEYWVAQGLVSGPITDTLSVLAAASTIQRDGFQENVDNGKKYDELDRDYWTISLASETTDRWSNSIKVMDTTSDYRQDAGYILSPYETDPVQEVFNTSAPFEQTNFVSTYPGTNFANPNQGMTRENPALNDENDVAVDTNPWTENSRTSATFISEYDFDSFAVKYTLGYTDFKFKRLDDADVSNAADSGLDYSVLPMSAFGGLTVDIFTGFAQTPSMIELPYRQDNKTWSHELQFTTDLQGDFNYIAGLYYYDSDEDQFQQFIERNDELMANYTFLGNLTGLPTSTDGTLYRGEGNLKTTSYAAYGQMNWDWSESTVVTLGLRYSYDEKEASDNTFVQWVVPDVVTDPNDTTVYREGKEDWDKVTWRIGVDHLLSDDHFVYGFAASGYRSGGYNLLAPTTSTDLDTVSPEELISYEVGYKGSFMEKRLNLTTALFYYDYDDLQVLKSEAINGVTVATFENAADATAWGLETELTALLTDQLMISGTYSYNSTEYDNYDSLDSSACTLGPLRVGDTQDPLCTDTQDLSGNEFPLSPENKLAINLIYSWELLAHDWSAMVSYQYTDDQWLQSFNDKNYDELESYDRWDARLNLMSPEGTWEATAFVNNISDDREEIYRARPSPVSGLAASSLTDPRTYGLKFSYNF